jgi:CPA2 family monovalent cation:H+ antiporter-2
LISGPLQILLTILAGAGIGFLVGLAWDEALVVGILLSLSSTACVVRVLRDRAEIDSPFGRCSLGILLIQDAAVVPLVFFVTALMTGGTIQEVISRMLILVLLATVLMAGFYLLFSRIIPRILLMPTWRRNRDLPVLLAVCMAGGSAWLAHAMQLSPALGAFLAGVLLAVSPYATQIQADVQPLRSLLVTLFIASIGMFGDLAWSLQNWTTVLAVAFGILSLKAVIVTGITRAAQLPLQFAVATGCCLAQIGEFSFVLAMIARPTTGQDPLLSEDVFRALVAATLLALLATPYLIAVGPRVGGWLERSLRSLGMGTPCGSAEPSLEPDILEDASKTDQGANRILILGFGPAGQRVAEELLSGHHDQLIVVDLNFDNVAIAQRYGLSAYLGDATQTDVLEHAGIHRADIVVVTIPSPSTTRRLIPLLRRLAPAALLLVRSRYHVHRWELLRAGAHEVVDEEDQVGHRLAEEVRRVLKERRPEPG